MALAGSSGTNAAASEASVRIAFLNWNSCFSDKIQGGDFFSGKGFFIIEIGQKHGYLAVQMNQSDDSQAEKTTILPVFNRQFLQIVIGGSHPDYGVFFAAFYESGDRCKRTGCRAAENKIAREIIQRKPNQLKAGIALVKQPDTFSRVGNKRHKLPGLFPLIGLRDSDDGSGNGQAAENVVKRGNQAQGEMPFPRRSQTALRVEFLPDFFSSRQGKLRTICSVNR